MEHPAQDMHPADEIDTSSALITNIQRFSIDDGPGIRTTVFFKGCSLSCEWCHNPECISADIELQFNTASCLRCYRCVTACPKICISQSKAGVQIDRSACDMCGACVRTCVSSALTFVGSVFNVSELMQVISRDTAFYKVSGGGVTFSGGEPLLHARFLKSILPLCKESGFHIAIDTAGNVRFQAFEEVMPYVDLYLYDIKALDPQTHRYATGSDNRAILENLKKLSERTQAEIIIRIPIIPGINDTIQDMKQIRSMVSHLKQVSRIDLLPYHAYGRSKYISLGIHDSGSNFHAPTEEKMQELRKAVLF